jgi:Na+-translocating ferredoxin:NAD+ oxidoreductase RnfC subunit
MIADTKEISRAVRAAGVVGAGGAGFPTYGKLESLVERAVIPSPRPEVVRKFM